MATNTILRCDLRSQYKKYKKEINAAVKKVLESGRYTLGEEVELFEKEFAAYHGCNHAVGVASATDGLMLSLKALGVGEGDEVIATPFTAIPTVSAIIASGARPVFVDIDEKTFLIDIERIPDFITHKTKAIMPVHIFGNMVDVKRLRSLIPENIPIIEDAAQAHGSKIWGVRSGAIGNIGVFSFYPTKNLGCYGDGGAVVTNNAGIAERLKLMRMYGMVNKDEIVINGINSRLDELQAAILRKKLKYLDEMNGLRDKIAKRYRESLDRRHFDFQHISDNVFCNYHVFALRMKDGRDELIGFLEKNKIQTNVYYHVPLHLQEANKFLGYSRGDLPKTERLCREIIALPMYPELTERAVDKVIRTINKFVKKRI